MQACMKHNIEVCSDLCVMTCRPLDTALITTILCTYFENKICHKQFQFPTPYIPCNIFNDTIHVNQHLCTILCILNHMPVFTPFTTLIHWSLTV